MKNIILFLIVLAVYSQPVLSQVIFSNGTGGGNWNETSTWLGGTVPGLNSDVIIAGTDSVLADGSGLGCVNFTVLSGGKFATAIDSFTVTGMFTLEADAYYYNRANDPTLPGVEIILDPASYVVHSGSGTVGGEENREFGNLVIARSAGATAGADLIINGNLIINNTASNVVFRGARNTGSRSHIVNGNVYVNKGIFSCIDTGEPGMVGVWDIKGDVYVTDIADTNYLEARIGPFSSASAEGLGIINIGGDLIVDGGRLQAGTSSTAGSGQGIVNLAGDLVLTATSSVATNTLGPFSLNFTGTGTQNVSIVRSFSMNTMVYDTVKAGANVVFDLDTAGWRSTTGGDFVVEGSLELKGNSRLFGAGNFTLKSGGTLKIGAETGISTAGELGNIQLAGTRTFDPDASYEYKGTETQVPGDGLPLTIKNLTVNNSSGLVLFGNYTVNTSFNVISGYVDLNTNILTLGTDAMLTEAAGNTVTGAGKIVTSREINSPAGINIGGIGVYISSGSNLGLTTIERYHSAATGNGNQGILRYYNVAPANNTGLNAALRLYYDESNLNELTEANLVMFSSADASNGSWIKKGGTVNTADNYVELSGVNELSYWTLGATDKTLPVEQGSMLPAKFALRQNYPNPFNPATTIQFELPEGAFVNISIFNSLGEKVATITDRYLPGGYYQENFNAANLSSGMYICKMTAGNNSFLSKMILLK